MTKRDSHQFIGDRYGHPMDCWITAEALAKLDGADIATDSAAMARLFRTHEAEIHRIVTAMVRDGDIPEEGITIRAIDVERLRRS